MNEPEQIEIDREAWRRRLGDAGAPSARVDKLIRAQARRAAAPRASRWTLPVSLAAAVVLAVVLAQWQVEDERMHPLVDESQALKQQAPDAAADVIVPAVVEPELPAAAPAEFPESSDVPAVPPPMLELPQQDIARERDAEALGNVAVTGTSKARSEDAPAVEQETPTTAVTAGRLAAPRAPAAAPAPAPKQENVTATAQRRDEAGADVPKRSPEDWYAEIEALRAEGRDAEADEETRKLQAEYPGWLESRKYPEP